MMKVLDATLAAGVKIGNVSEWCRAHDVDRRTFYRHRARIGAEGSWQPRSRRPKAFPGQTAPQVEAAIIRLRNELAPDNGADMIVAGLRQIAVRCGWQEQGLRVPHRSTVHKVLARSGLVEPQPRKRPKSSYRRFAYARPRDCYQLDATEVKLAGGSRVVVFDVLDDCTRLLAACRAADAETASAAVQAIRAAAAECGPPGIVLCDNGAAFTGGPRARGAAASAFSRAVAAMNSRLIHSSPYHPQTCGKVERHHQTLKKWLATRPAATSLAGLQELLDDYRDWYNAARHHTAVRTTPRQAWDNARSHGGPGVLPRQDDATVHKLTVGSTGNVKLGHLYIHLSNDRAGQHITIIRDHDRVTAYDPDGEPIGSLKLDHAKRYQGTLTPAA